MLDYLRRLWSWLTGSEPPAEQQTPSDRDNASDDVPDLRVENGYDWPEGGEDGR